MPRKTKQNKICAPDILEKVSNENKQLIADFLSYMKSIQRSPTTIEAYGHDLNIWACWNVEYNNNKFFCDLSKRNIVAYQDWLLNENGNSPARVRRLKSALSSMADYVELILDDEYPTFRNFVNSIKAPILQPVREKTILTQEQVDELLKHLIDKKQYQKACLLALAVSSGARKSELVRFKVDFFKEENLLYGSLYKTPKIKTKGRGDGKYIPKFVFKNGFQEYLDLWLNERSKLNINSEWLFVAKTENGWKQLSAGTITSWMNSFSRYLGVDVYAHCLRHLWCTLALSKGLSPTVVQELQKWQSQNMIAIYDDREIEDEFGKYFGENGIKQIEQKNLSEI